jgi:hypothetical protein
VSETLGHTLYWPFFNSGQEMMVSTFQMHVAIPAKMDHAAFFLPRQAYQHSIKLCRKKGLPQHVIKV